MVKLNENSTPIWSEDCKEKRINPDDLRHVSNELRDNKNTIVTLNGSFDLLHAGHLQIIYEAKQQGDILIVLLNTDESIKKYKGKGRPIISLKYRLEMISALSFVDYVSWFNEADPCKILSIIKPDIHVNGPEYGLNCIEAESIKENGGKIHIAKFIPGLSTTKLLEKIKHLETSCV